MDIYEEAQGLEATFGHWGSLGAFPPSDWQYEVANGDTRLGYWMWAATKLVEG